MSLHLYNTLTRAVEPFVPLEPGRVRMYVCGPTVYDEPHIGHARSAYVFDLLRRHLEHQGLQVTFVRNVTDVDDKIIEKAKQELAASNQPSAISIAEKCREVAERYLKSYHDVLEHLGIGRPTLEPKATEHVNRTPDAGLGSMTDLIAKLLVQGAAYEAGGDVYFAVRKFPGYGALSQRSLDELQAGARVEPGERKQDPLDFALWKAAKPGEPSWKSPWGEGRPGWHIECSAMSTKYLGDQFDIHGGGVDLVFPHHENEIAQAQAAGKPFAKVWIHNGLLTVNGEKMSKSLGNFIDIIHALTECNTQPDVLKLLFLMAHYRSPQDYNHLAIQTARGMYERMERFILQAAHANRDAREPARQEWLEIMEGHLQDAEEALDNDLNTPMALGALFELITFVNRTLTSHPPTRGDEISLLLDSVTRLKNFCRSRFNLELTLRLVLEDNIAIDDERGIEFQISQQDRDQVNQLLVEREAARQRGDFKRADEIRASLRERGVVVEDTPSGQKVRYLRL